MAGLGYKDFTAGAVLTAAQVDGYLMEQSVMNFAGTAARGSALSSVQAAGMMAHVGGGTVTVYDGSAWQQVYPAQAGLVFVAGTAFSAVSSVSVNNCFTSSYANYLLIVNITAASAAGAGVDLRLRVSGVDNSSSNYYNIAMGWSANAANPTFFAEGSNGTATVGKTPIRLASGAESSGQVRISNPFATQYTTWDGMGTQTNVTTNLLFMQQTHSGTTVTTSYDGFSLIPTSGTFTGTVRVYGYRNS